MSTSASGFKRAQSNGHYSWEWLLSKRERHAVRRPSGRPELIGRLEMRTLLAHSPIALPYTTSFAPTADTNGDVYQNGALQGQALGTMSPASGWVNENGETNDTATVTVGSGVTLTSQDTPGVWSDVYNSNLADHPAAPGNGHGVPLDSANYGGQIVVSFSMDVSGSGTHGANGTAAAAFGSRILDSGDNLLAALYVKGDPSTAGQENVYVQTGTDEAQVTDFVGPANNTSGNYSIALDFTHHEFKVTVGGSSTAEIPFGTGESSAAEIGGVTLATDNNGADSATFSTLSVTSPTAVALHLHTDGTSSALATGKTSPITGDSPLTSTATVTNQLKIWLGVSRTETGSASATASGSTSTTFAADGLIAPAGKDSYSTTFSDVGDRVAVNLSMSAAAGVLNLLGIAVPTSALKPSSKLVSELDKIYKTTDLGAAEADFSAGAAGRLSAASAAHAIADHLSELSASGGAQWALVQHDLKDAGVTLTAAQVKTLENVTTTDRLSKTLIATAKLDTQLATGQPIEVNFFASAG